MRRHSANPHQVALVVVAAWGSVACYVLGVPPKPTSAGQPPPSSRMTPAVMTAVAPPAIERVHGRDSVLALLPRDAAGNVDWNAALRSGVIRPRAAVPGRDSSAFHPGFGFDFYTPAAMPMAEAFFPHSGHTQWVACTSCHAAVYRYPRDTTTTMAAINAGQSCGVCHRAVAFPASTCERCHAALSMPPGRVTATLDDDVLIARPESVTAASARSYGPARFSHAMHRIRYRCTACHETLFPMKAGAGAMSKARMQQGDGCGACHDGTTAFGFVNCTQCHAGRAG
ncbi:MAG: multiheme c-type cytochrome [Gemmatimonadota bacterium]|nr:multiheme c-type cytochrome [Gemmatimonadota bacterium]MDH5196632.1 multiheme c-type cytochrome [Gemmatimonadota bacterium]